LGQIERILYNPQLQNFSFSSFLHPKSHDEFQQFSTEELGDACADCHGEDPFLAALGGAHGLSTAASRGWATGAGMAALWLGWGWCGDGAKLYIFFGKNQGILDCLSLMIVYHDSSESPRIAGCRLHPQVFGREPALDIYNQERIVKRRWELKRFQHGHVSRCFQERSAMPGLQPVTPS